jgi:hypothetical protein
MNSINIIRISISVGVKLVSEIRKHLADDGKISLEEGLEIFQSVVPDLLGVVMSFSRDKESSE